MEKSYTIKAFMGHMHKLYFKDVDMSPWYSHDKSVRHEFLLAQADRVCENDVLLEFGEFFWTDRNKKNVFSELNDHKSVLRSGVDLRLIRFYESLGRIGMFFYYHTRTFDLRRIIPDMPVQRHQEDYFDVRNEHLIKWLTTTPHLRLAAHVAKTLYNIYLHRCTRMNEPLQDYLANGHFSDDLTPCKSDEHVREAIENLLACLRRVHEHYDAGHGLKLSDECIALHDELLGDFYGSDSQIRFEDKAVLTAAKSLYRFIKKESAGRRRQEKLKQEVFEKMRRLDRQHNLCLTVYNFMYVESHMTKRKYGDFEKIYFGK